jgi:hypothetical protein
VWKFLGQENFLQKALCFSVAFNYFEATETDKRKFSTITRKSTSQIIFFSQFWQLWHSLVKVKLEVSYRTSVILRLPFLFLPKYDKEFVMPNKPQKDYSVRTLTYKSKHLMKLDDELAIFEAAFFGLVSEVELHDDKSEVPNGAVLSYYKMRETLKKILGR